MAFGRARLVDAGLRAGAAASSTCTATAITKEFELFENDAHPAPFLFRILIFPLVELQPALDKKRSAFGDELGDGLALPAPRFDVHEDDFLATLAGLHLELAIDREREL